MATDRADARDTSQSATQLQRIDGFASRHFAVLIAAVGLLCAALMFHATRGGVFHNDDVQLIGQAQDHGFSVRGLFGEPQFLEHLVPVSNILSWFVAVTGAHWWVAHWYSALGTALLTVLMGYLLRRIAQSSAVALVVAAAVGSSMVIATIALWWAATTLQLGMLCAGAAMLILSLRWIDSRSRWALTGALFFQLLACGFYDRAQLLPLLAWALVAVARPSGQALTGRSFVDQSRAAAPLLVGLLAIVIAQFVLTLVFGVQNSEGLEAAAHTSLATWVEVVADWWVNYKGR